jgi:hypothetical protein
MSSIVKLLKSEREMILYQADITMIMEQGNFDEAYINLILIQELNGEVSLTKSLRK